MCVGEALAADALMIEISFMKPTTFPSYITTDVCYNQTGPVALQYVVVVLVVVVGAVVAVAVVVVVVVVVLVAVAVVAAAAGAAAAGILTSLPIYATT